MEEAEIKSTEGLDVPVEDFSNNEKISNNTEIILGSYNAEKLTEENKLDEARLKYLEARYKYEKLSSEFRSSLNLDKEIDLGIFKSELDKLKSDYEQALGKFITKKNKKEGDDENSIKFMKITEACKMQEVMDSIRMKESSNASFLEKNVGKFVETYNNAETKNSEGVDNLNENSKPENKKLLEKEKQESIIDEDILMVDKLKKLNELIGPEKDSKIAGRRAMEKLSGNNYSQWVSIRNAKLSEILESSESKFEKVKGMYEDYKFIFGQNAEPQGDESTFEWLKRMLKSAQRKTI